MAGPLLGTWSFPGGSDLIGKPFLPLVVFEDTGNRSLFCSYWTGGAGSKGMKGEGRHEQEVMKEKPNLTPGH